MDKEAWKDEVTGMLRLKLRMKRKKQTRLMLLFTLCVSFVISGIGLLSCSRYHKGLDTEPNTPIIELL